MLPVMVWKFCDTTNSKSAGLPSTGSLQRHLPAAFAGTTQKNTLLFLSRPTGLSGASSTIC